MDVTCMECGSYPKKIGKEVFYCEECDRIFTVEEPIPKNSRKVLVH